MTNYMVKSGSGTGSKSKSGTALVILVDFCLTLVLFLLPVVCGVWLKDDPTPKMWLPSNAWKFLRQILYGRLAEFCQFTSFFLRNYFVYTKLA